MKKTARLQMALPSEFLESALYKLTTPYHLSWWLPMLGTCGLYQL